MAKSDHHGNKPVVRVPVKQASLGSDVPLEVHSATISHILDGKFEKPN